MYLSQFARNTLTVLSGTVITQAIPMVVLICLSRLLSPTDIGNFTLVMSTVSIASIVISAGLDKAFFSAPTEKEVIELLYFSIVVGSFISIIIFAAILINQSLNSVLFDKTIEHYAICIVLHALTLSLNKSLQSILIRRSQFWLLNKAKFFLVVSIALGQLISVVISFNKVDGLIYSTTILSVLSTLLVWNLSALDWHQVFGNNSVIFLRKIFSENSQFVKFSLPAEIISMISSQLPIFIIASRFGSSQVAMYAMMLRIVSIPVGLLGSSILTVFKDKAGQEYREIGSCRNTYIRTFRYLAVLSLFPFLSLYFFGPDIIEFLLGQQWSMTGEFVRILSPMLFVSFISSPLSYVMFFSKQGQVINIMFQAILSTIMLIVFSQANTANDAVLCYSICGSMYYSFYLLISYRFASGGLVKVAG
jgi:O-antigen/teichoic acid export membrane protein